MLLVNIYTTFCWVWPANGHGGIWPRPVFTTQMVSDTLTSISNLRNRLIEIVFFFETHCDRNAICDVIARIRRQPEKRNSWDTKTAIRDLRRLTSLLYGLGDVDVLKWNINPDTAHRMSRRTVVSMLQMPVALYWSQRSHEATVRQRNNHRAFTTDDIWTGGRSSKIFFWVLRWRNFLDIFPCVAANYSIFLPPHELDSQFVHALVIADDAEDDAHRHLLLSTTRCGLICVVFITACFTPQTYPLEPNTILHEVWNVDEGCVMNAHEATVVLMSSLLKCVASQFTGHRLGSLVSNYTPKTGVQKPTAGCTLTAIRLWK